MDEPFDLLGEIERQAEERDFRVNRDTAQSDFDGAEERKDPGFFRTLGAAFENENTISTINRAMERNALSRQGPTIDAANLIERDEYKSRLDNLPEEYRTTALEARTEAELRFILRSAEERVRNAETLQAGGMLQALGSYMGVGLVDPVDWAVSLATGGAGKVLATGNTLRRATVGGLSAGAANAAVEATISSEDPTRTGTDVAAAFAVGMGLGGLLSMRGGARVEPEDVELQDAMSRGLDNVVQGNFRPRAANEVETDPLPMLPSAGSAGAARTEVEDVEFFGTQFLAPGAYGRLLDKSVPKEMRSLASELIAGTSRVDDETRAIAAEEISASLERSWRGQNYLSYNPHFESWRKEQGIGLLRADLTSGPQQEFMRQVTRAMLGDTEVAPQARAAANSFADSYTEILRRAKEARVEGFDDVKFDRGYVPRRINSSKFMQVRNEIGAEGVQAILRQAMIANGMDPNLARRVAKAYEEGTVDRITNRRVDTFTGPSEDSVERLRYYLPDDDPELVEEVIAYLRNFRKEANPDAGRISEARFRIDMDLLEPLTVNGKTFRALDIFEDDAAMLFERYSRTMSGWVALAERSGIRSQNDWDIRLKEATKGREGDPRTAERIERMNEVKDLILGRSITNENGTARRAGQAFMKLNFATSMGQAGMASIAEMGNILANMGVRNAMAHMPAFRSIFAGARDGTLDDAFTDELRALFGVGMRTKTSRGRAGYDEFGGEIETKLFDTVDRILDPAARGVGYAGMIGPVNDYLQLLASKSFLQKLARVATGKNSFSEADKVRLRDAGFEDGVLDRVLTAIRENGSFEGKRLVSLNADKWDRELLSSLQYSTDRMVYRAVQENDIGSSAWWMHTMLGRMATQFRSFIINAYVKQTLHALRFRDRQAFAGLALTTAFGGLAWLARTYTNTATDPEMREKLLTPEKMATAAMSATGYASILPTVIDTGLVQAGNDPLFSHVRTTGLSTSLIQGAPVVATTDNLVATATLPLRLPRDDYEFSQDDLKKITRLLPFNNVTGIRNAIDLVEAELPRRSQEDNPRE